MNLYDYLKENTMCGSAYDMISIKTNSDDYEKLSSSDRDLYKAQFA